MKKEFNDYYNRPYDHFARWASYWYQIHEIMKLSPSKVLEVGIGNGTVANYLKNRGISLKTLDINKELKPDIVSSVLDIPVEDKSFDIVCAFEVLEHLPFDDFERGLSELKRVSSKYVIISLPQWGRLFKLHLKIPLLPHLKWLFKMPGFKKHIMGKEEHYWEIEKRGYPLSLIKSKIRNTNFEIINDYILFEQPYHHIFILKK